MADQPPNPQRRIKLRDGRYLAYKERGVSKDDAKFTIVLVHGFGSSKDMNFNVSQVCTNLLIRHRSSSMSPKICFPFFVS